MSLLFYAGYLKWLCGEWLRAQEDHPPCFYNSAGSNPTGSPSCLKLDFQDSNRHGFKS